MTTMICAPRPTAAPEGAKRSSLTDLDLRHLGRRLAAALVGSVVLVGTRPVEDVDDLDAGDIPGPVLENPHLRAEAEQLHTVAHGRP